MDAPGLSFDGRLSNLVAGDMVILYEARQGKWLSRLIGVGFVHRLLSFFYTCFSSGSHVASDELHCMFYCPAMKLSMQKKSMIAIEVYS